MTLEQAEALQKIFSQAEQARIKINDLHQHRNDLLAQFREKIKDCDHTVQTDGGRLVSQVFPQDKRGNAMCIICRRSFKIGDEINV